MSYRIINGDSAKELKKFKDNSIDAVITDPPYGIEFLAKEWDENTGAVEIWSECLRVLKPGGFLLAFSAARTYHIFATNIQSAGFEIRDQIMWLYASGFPKAQDIGKAIDRRLTKQKTDIRAEYNGGKHGSKNVDLGMQGVRCPVCKRDSNARYDCKEQECGMIYKAQTPEALNWSGWKSALKPAHEPICMARKPMKGSAVDNVLKHNVGALNIDESRIPFDNSKEDIHAQDQWRVQRRSGVQLKWHGMEGKVTKQDFNEQVPQGRFPSNVIGEIEGYQKYFYCPKVSRKERHRGFEQIPDPISNYSQGDVKNHPLWDKSIGTNLQRLKHKIMEHNKDVGPNLDPLSHIPTSEGMYNVDGTGVQYNSNKYKAVGNNHPTVKPVALMKYLIKLVAPQGSHIIDPFMGSGTTGMAAKELGITFTGIEMDKNYCDIAKRRIDASKADQFEKLFDDTIVNE